MFSLILLEILAVVSLLYSLLLVFLDFAPVELMVLFFVWSVGISLFYHYSRRWSKIFYASILLLWAPLILYRDRNAIAFFLITVPLIHLYVEKFLLRGSRQEYAGTFGKVSVIYLAAFYLRWLMPDTTSALGLSAPFIFVYFLASVILIRSVRHVEAGMDLRRLQAANIRYLLLTAGVFALTAFDQVRQFIYYLAGRFTALLALPFSLLFRGIESFMNMLVYWGVKFPKELPGPDSEIIPDLPPAEEAIEEAVATGGPVEKIWIALLIGAAIFVFYKLMVRAGHKSYRGLDYVEEREYIKRKRKTKRRFHRREAKPGRPEQQVRYFYRLFLKKLAAADVQVAGSDTTADINDKASLVFSPGPEKIRAIYIANRYGEKDTRNSELAELERLCRDLSPKKGG